jgi:hypothetical protein
MMDQAVERMDSLYTRALTDGILRADPSLIIEEPVDPETLEMEEVEEPAVEADVNGDAGVQSISVQFDTPDAGSVEQGEAALRSIPGVRSAITSSLALGGTSVMSVSYAGTPENLRAALAARGWTVAISGNTMRIQRRAPSAGAAANGQ